ncbi:hypothetical protein [Radiobacillus sp. PE A8.2]|uniref:hypothetical protein n=1 Tax=Radiobacillus sp. PE A8.2 TaxID=3380349 RepID=UPI00388FD988
MTLWTIHLAFGAIILPCGAIPDCCGAISLECGAIPPRSGAIVRVYGAILVAIPPNYGQFPLQSKKAPI